MNSKFFVKLFIVLAVALVAFAVVKIYMDYNADIESNKTESSKQDIKILIYSKKHCIFCIKAKDLLDSKGLDYEVIQLSNNRDLHLKLASQTGQNTVPYIFINGNFIGGFKNLQDLEISGEL